MAVRTGSEVEVARLPAHVDAFDGLRAIAILAVLAFHLRLAGVPFREGGYLGVDVFFVLSGFLITSLLIAERARFGRVSLGDFSGRRAVRLLPVLFVLLAIAAVVFVTTPASYDLRPTPLAFVATATAWMNWLDIWQPTAGGMLAHTWSLSIEAQFYVVFPLFLVLAWRLRLKWRTIAILLVGFVVVGAAVRARIWLDAPAVSPDSVDPVWRYVNGLERGRAWTRWYFGSFSHLDGLLLGALAAVAMVAGPTLGWLRSRARTTRAFGVAAAAVVAAVFVGADATGISGFVPLVGLPALEVGMAVLIVTLVVQPTAPLGRALGVRPMVWVGRRSYAMYVLHIPVWMLVVELVSSVRPLPVSESATIGWVSLLLTFAVADLSMRCIEGPAAARWKARFTPGR